MKCFKRLVNSMRTTTILLLMLFCTVPVISIVMANHISVTQTIRNMGNRTFGNEAVMVMVSEEIASEQLAESAFSLKNTAVYIDDNDDTGVVRYMVYNGKYCDFPMKEGRFFIPSDFLCDNRVCVVGKERSEQIYERDGVKYILQQGNEYRVLGVIGYQESTIIDTWIFVNALSEKSIRNNRILIFDSFSKSSGTVFSETVLTCMKNCDVNAEICSETSSFSDSIMPELLSGRWFFSLIIACFCSLFLISGRWIDNQKREICICRMAGASIKDICFQIAAKYFCIFLISSLVSGIYCFLLYPAYITYYLKGEMISAALALLFLAGSLNRLLSVPIGEGIQ